MDSISDTLLISIDGSHGKDTTVLLVGRKKPNQSVEIVNAFQGPEAIDIYNKLLQRPGGVTNV